jgi:hypothetical protein
MATLMDGVNGGRAIAPERRSVGGRIPRRCFVSYGPADLAQPCSAVDSRFDALAVRGNGHLLTSQSGGAGPLHRSASDLPAATRHLHGAASGRDMARAQPAIVYSARQPHGASFSVHTCCSRNLLTSSRQGSGAVGSAGVKSLCSCEKSPTSELDAQPLCGEATFPA